MTVTYLPQQSVEDERAQENFEYIQNHAVFIPHLGPTRITGSRGGNVALANLLTELAARGLIVDGTT